MTESNPNREPVRVLIVEDSPVQMEHLKIILENAGYNVVCAKNGKVALDLIAGDKPDLVLSDIVMPEMDGYELCRRIKADSQLRHIPVILVTALFDPEDVIHGLECGADNFIPKPYDEKYLLSRIEIVLANQRVMDHEPVQIGLDIQFAGKQHHISSGRLQILNLLLSTYETAVQKNHELELTKEELTTANEDLMTEINCRTEVEKALQKSLGEKEVLLREIHHRVKNNLQIVISLLNLQSKYIRDENVLAAIRETQNRIKSMALVHERLYRSEDISNINITGYVKFLTTNLFNFYTIHSQKVALRVDISDVAVDINKAIPLGLILNELITNSLKYAFPGDKKGTINISMKYNMGTYILDIGDTGIGIPDGLDWKNTGSLGLRLVNSLVEQLKGTIDLDCNQGTRFTIIFPKE